MSVSTRGALAVLLLACGSLFESSLAAYSLTKNYAGDSFFDDWTYYGHYDNLTNGDVNFVTREQGMNASNPLTYVNSASHAIIKVDNTSFVPYNEKRNTVRIESTDQFDIGSLVLVDLYHTPYGCSVWPAFWMLGDPWPANGEIDIFEGVNLQTTNQVALHTDAGCTFSNSSALSANATGVLTYGNCDATVNSNSGCTVRDTSTQSYGQGLAASDGGVYAAQFARQGISVWYFPRSSIPSDISSNSSSPNPSGWGKPSAFYGTSTCDIQEHFGPQRLLFTITLCGDWAGTPAVFNQTCTGTCYVDYVLNATNYNDAYFEVASVKVFNDPDNARTNAVPSSSSSSNSASTNANATNSGTGTWSLMSFGALATTVLGSALGVLL